MQNLSKTYALAEFIPEISDILRLDDENIIAQQIAGIAEKITKTESTVETIKLLTEPENLELFKKELLKIAIKFKKYPQKQTTTIISILTISMLACISVIVFFKCDIPSEAIPIISTIAGIFGSCLKDAFESTFPKNTTCNKGS